MKITKTIVRTFDIYNCVKWNYSVGDTIAVRDKNKIKSNHLLKCFICNHEFNSDEFPYLAFVSNYKNQFICETCANMVIKENNKNRSL